MKSKRVLPVLFTLIILFLMAMLILYPEKYIAASASGLLLFARLVLPALLPFMFMTAILTGIGGAELISRAFSPLTDKLFKSGGLSPYVYFMSVLSGYPVGSKIIADLYENKTISSAQAAKMATFCSTSGPLFIIGSVGAGMLGDKNLGFLLYGVHIISGIICGVIFRGKAQSSPPLLMKKQNADQILNKAMLESALSLLCVGGFITVFYILAHILQDIGALLPLEMFLKLIFLPFSNSGAAAKPMSVGLVEMTLGCELLSAQSGTFSLCAVSFLIAFGGLSIIIQQLMFLKKAKVCAGFFLLTKTVHAFLSFFLCFLLSVLKVF